jgi:hypothetical protein
MLLKQYFVVGLFWYLLQTRIGANHQQQQQHEMTDSTAASWRTSTSPSCSTFLSWKRLYGLYQRYILPEYQKPLLYTFLGILFLSLWRLVWKVSPLDLFHWLDVEYYLQNEDGTTFGYVYFPLVSRERKRDVLCELSILGHYSVVYYHSDCIYKGNQPSSVSLLF